MTDSDQGGSKPMAVEKWTNWEVVFEPTPSVRQVIDFTAMADLLLDWTEDPATIARWGDVLVGSDERPERRVTFTISEDAARSSSRPLAIEDFMEEIASQLLRLEYEGSVWCRREIALFRPPEYLREMIEAQHGAAEARHGARRACDAYEEGEE